MKRLVPVVVTVFVLGTLPGCGEMTLICAGVLEAGMRGQYGAPPGAGAAAGAICGMGLELCLWGWSESTVRGTGYWDTHLFFVPAAGWAEKARARRARGRLARELARPERERKQRLRLERDQRIKKLGSYIFGGLGFAGLGLFVFGLATQDADLAGLGGFGGWTCLGLAIVLEDDSKPGSQKAELFIAPNGFALAYRF